MRALRFFDANFFAGLGVGVVCTVVVLVGGALLLRERPARPATVPPPAAAEALPLPGLRVPAVPEGAPDVLGVADGALQLRTLAGEPVALPDFRGRTVLVNLWATWCGPCRLEMPTLQALHEDLPGGLALVVASDEDAETVREYVDAAGYTFPIYLYEDPRPGPFAGEFLPTTYVVTPNGDVVFEHIGAADWNAPAVREFLGRLEEG